MPHEIGFGNHSFGHRWPTLIAGLLEDRVKEAIGTHFTLVVGHCIGHMSHFSVASSKHAGFQYDTHYFSLNGRTFFIHNQKRIPSSLFLSLSLSSMTNSLQVIFLSSQKPLLNIFSSDLKVFGDPFVKIDQI